ncbi:MAG: glycosyltransferase [Candidatus Paceibacterota bacterium]
MLPLVEISDRDFDEYKQHIPEEMFNEIKDLAEELQGLEVTMVNATPKGGGVAEVLKSLVPLMQDVGLEAKWHVIPPREDFFKLTKSMHNSLQGEDFKLNFEERKLYQRHMEKMADQMQDMESDVWVMHDPQPAGVIQYLSDKECYPMISRIHIDTTNPGRESWNFIEGFLLQYDKIIFHCKDFVHDNVFGDRIEIMPPAIDPFIDKNKELDQQEINAVLEGFGINTDKPLVSQISRFDPWKDPVGVVEAYHQAKEEIPDLQLAYLGLFLASDDPQAQEIYEKTKEKVKPEDDIYLFTDPNRLGSLSVGKFVNAFQAGSDVVMQKSVREGFGLTVTEAMWKGTPVVGGDVGGIKLQIENGKNGYLVSSPAGAAEKTVKLIKNPELREKLGNEARETVKKKFLMPRLLRDYLRLFKDLDEEGKIDRC